MRLNLERNGKNFMAKFKEPTDEHIARARAQGRAFQRDPSYATGVEYDEASDTIAIYFRCGGTISVPRRSYPGLEKRKPIGPITVLGGDGLDVEAMDLQVYIPGLIEHVFGPRLITHAAAVYAGRQKSEAKARAARLNGRKGGRPRKNKAA
jgi:hypothetical protein